MHQLEDTRIVKASFRDCPIPDRKLFGSSTCIMPISVGQSVHEGKKLLAILKLIDASFKACTILIDDSVQRHTLKIDHDESDEVLYRMAVQEGDDWLERNKIYLQLLTIPHQIMRWDDWLNRASYAPSREKVLACYENNEQYRSQIHANIHEFLSRYLERIPDQSTIDYARAFALCLEYLLEECSVMRIWVENQYEFEVYPSGRNKAMGATYEHLIQQDYPNYLKSVALRFKKYPQKSHTNDDEDMRMLMKED